MFSSDSDWEYKESSLVELNATNSSSIWKNMLVKEIIESEESDTVDNVQSNKSSSINTSQVTENEEKSKQSPCFFFLHFLPVLG